jgi:hypothetical protein
MQSGMDGQAAAAGGSGNGRPRRAVCPGQRLHQVAGGPRGIGRLAADLPNVEYRVVGRGEDQSRELTAPYGLKSLMRPDAALISCEPTADRSAFSDT